MLQGEFEWSDGTGLATFTNWDAGEPNNEFGEHCTNLKLDTAGGVWNDVPCDTVQRAFVCEIRAFIPPDVAHS